MRKGDEKRREILTVAEKLFYSKGYDETSVQDILDVLHTSKGSFYHHFESKDALLETLCATKTERACAMAEEALKTVDDPMQRLNRVLYYAIPLRRVEIPFLKMTLPLLFRPEGRAVCRCFEEAIRDAFVPCVSAELDNAISKGVIYPPTGDALPELVLHVTSCCWMDVAQELIDGIKKGQRCQVGALMERLELYRRAMERMLDAPYGSMELLRVDEWQAVSDAMTSQAMLPMQRT